MFIRSEVRHTCYRMKNGGSYKPQLQYIVDHVSGLMDKEKWEDFSDKWDVFVTRDNLTIITPEIDQTFITATCTKIKTMAELGIEDMSDKLSTREQNVKEIIELNYSGREVPWTEFGQTWGTRVIHDDKRFEPYMFSTQVNEVPEPAIPEVGETEPVRAEVTDFNEMTEEEKAIFKKMIAKMNLG